MQYAFEFIKDSRMYNAFFAQMNEKERIRKNLVVPFINTYLPEAFQNRSYFIEERLGIQLTPDEQKRFASQLKKTPVYHNGETYFLFKLNSEMNKRWVNEVYNKIDHKAIEGFFCWHLEFNMFGGGHTELLIDGDRLYGIISPNNEYEQIQFPDWARQIKVSEYYAISERLAEESKS